MRARLKKLIDDLPSVDTLEEIYNNRLDLPVDPVEWTKKVRIIKGEPFTFDGRDYLYQPYRDDAKIQYYAKGRQTEFTEFLANKLIFNAWKYPNTVHLYVSDRETHTSKFSNLRIRDWCLKPSEILNKIAPWKKHTATVLPFPNGSIAYFHSAWSGFEEARSVPADFVYLDEIQSTNTEEIDVLKETMGHSKHRNFYGVGTGKIAGSDWHKLYKSGTQYEWDTKSKSWIAKNPGSEIHSYNIPQTIVPWITAAEIEKKFNTYSRIRFITEVMGQFPKGIDKPLTEDMIKPLFDKNLSFLTPEQLKQQRNLGPVIAGIDWASGGASSTVVFIAQYIDINIPISRAISITKIDDHDIHRISQKVKNLINAYEPDFGIQDAGGNSSGIQDIEHEFGDLITKCSFMTRPADPWKDDDLEARNLIKVDRSYAFEQQIDIIARPHKFKKFPKPVPREQIPYADPQKIEWIIDQYTCVETKTTRLSSGEEHLIYTKPEESQYDGLLANIYKTLAFQLWKKKREFKGTMSTGTLGGGT